MAGLFLVAGCATDSSLPAAPQSPASSLSPALEQAAWQRGGGVARAEALLREAQGARRAALQNELLTLLAERELPEAGRLWVIRSLALVAGPEAVPSLATLCADPRWSAAAEDTLVRVPGGDAEVALLRLLSDEFFPSRAALVRVVERRQVQGAVPVLGTLARGEDLALAEASIRALGTIGSSGAYQALRALPVRPEFAELRVRALVAALARIAGTRTAPESIRSSAVRSCREVLSGPWPQTLRISSLQSLALFDGASASPELFAALRGEDAALRAAAVSAIVAARHSDLNSVVVSSWPGFPLPVRSALLEAFAANRDAVARELAFSALAAPEASLRSAGVEVLVRQGSAADLPRLLGLVAAQGENASEAAAILSRLSDPAVDPLLRERLGGAPAPLAAVLLEVSATRGDRAVFEPACIALESGLASDPSLRASALEAVRLLAAPGDLARLLTLLDRLQDVSEIRILEAALRSLAPRHPEPAAMASQLLARLGAPAPAPAPAPSGGPAASAPASAAMPAAAVSSASVADARLRALRAGIAGLDTPASAAYFTAGLARPGSADWRDQVRLLSSSAQFAHAGLLRSAVLAATGDDRDLALRGLILLCTQATRAPAPRREAALVALRPLAATQADRDALEKALATLRAAPPLPPPAAR